MYSANSAILLSSVHLLLGWHSIPIGFCTETDGELPLVHTGRGILQGKYWTSRNGNLYQAYLGVRYGHVEERFDISVPSGNWQGVKNATEFGPACGQISLIGSSNGEEDCLFLNILTPMIDNKKRPVLFYVHGGGFTVGSSTEYGGDYIIDEDIVLVTIGYRLGILGFLNTGDGVVSGNMGLKDQVLALKWVQENIEYFGGDKSRVIISGNSGGSASALYLMISPMAQGLFHGVIGFSGSPLNGWAFAEKTIQEAVEIGTNLNCKTGNTIDLVRCLREEPLETLMLSQKSIAKWNLDIFGVLPSIEVKNSRNREPFLEKHPEVLLREGNFAKVPVLLTATKDEGALIFAAIIIRTEPLLKELNEEFTRLAPFSFLYNKVPKLWSQRNEVAKKIRKFYFDDKEINADTEQNLTDLFNHIWFIRGIQKTAHILASQMPVFIGLFTHKRSDFSTISLFGMDDKLEDTVTHCDDLSYLFNPTGAPTPTPYMGVLTLQKNIAFSKKYVKLLGNFIKTGIPKVPNVESPNWDPVSKAEIESDSLNWYNLDDEPFIHIDPFKKGMDFWNELYNPTGNSEKEEL